MFFRRPTAPVATHPQLPPSDTVRPRSSSHATPTVRSSSQSHTHPHINSSSSSIFPSNSPIMRRDLASTRTASPTSRSQPTPQLLQRSSTANSPFSSFTSTASSSPSASPSHASSSTSHQQHVLLNSSFSLSTPSSAASSPRHHSTSSTPASPAHYSYHHFSQKMKDPLAATLVKRLKAIVNSVTSRPPLANDQLATISRDIHTQLHVLSGQLAAHPLFVRSSRDELVNAAESMEKFVLSKLHTTLYHPTHPASSLLARSRTFYAKCRALSWLHGRHLELPMEKQEASVWREAGAELRRMAEYKAPKDKLVCLLNACHIIHHTLITKGTAGSNDGESSAVGADDIFPAFIFALIHAHPRHFLLDLRWVTVGRYPEAMKGECEYWVTMAESAIVFVERMNESSIRVEREGEWDSEMSQARLRREEERKRRKETSVSGADRHSGGSSVDRMSGSGGKAEEEQKRSAEDDDRSVDRSDSDRENETAVAGSSARLSVSSNSSTSSNDDSVSERQSILNTDDDLNTSTASTASSSSSSLHHTPSISPTSSPLCATTPLPSPLLIPSSSSRATAALEAADAAAGAAGGGGGSVLLDSGGRLPLSYVSADAHELSGVDVVRLLNEYKEMAAIIKMWSAKGSEAAVC